MVRKSAIFILLFYSLAIAAYSQLSYQDSLLLNIIRTHGQAEVIVPVSNVRSMDYLTRRFSISSLKDGGVSIVLGPGSADTFISTVFDYKIVEPPDSKALISAKGAQALYDWQSYPTYSQYDSLMRSFQSLYPGLCRLDTIGTSINGKLVLALKISDNVSATEGEPKVFYSSTIHGDELAGYFLMLRLADYLLKNYPVNKLVKELVENLEIWINPLANPDGTYRTGNIISSPVRGNANGVDLNRNFPDPLNPSIIQEKETNDMISFMRKHRFVISANFHSGSEVVNYPWDRWLSKFHADDIWFNNISRGYADTVHLYSSPTYLRDLDDGVTRGAVWYIIYGGRQDFVTWELQGREVTIELDDIKQTPAAQLELLWQYNYRSLLRYVGNAMYGIHGKVRNSETLNPVAARIFITGHDKDSSHVYSDIASGNFTRFLSPGTWNLTFSAPGYKDTTVTAFVSEWQKSILIVDMVPVATLIESATRENPVIYPNPSSGYFWCLVPDEVCGSVSVEIVSQTGSTVFSEERETYPGEPLFIEVFDLSQGVYNIVVRNSINAKSSTGRIIIHGPS